MLDLVQLKLPDIVPVTVSGEFEERGKCLDMARIAVLVFSLNERTVMSSIMRRRRSLMGLLLMACS
jgi:hypothetical protein